MQNRVQTDLLICKTPLSSINLVQYCTNTLIGLEFFEPAGGAFRRCRPELYFLIKKLDATLILLFLLDHFSSLDTTGRRQPPRRLSRLECKQKFLRALGRLARGVTRIGFVFVVIIFLASFLLYQNSCKKNFTISLFSSKTHFF